jgi:hypothetical protein
MTSIQVSASAYEDWLRGQIGPAFVEADLDEKHRKMRKDAFGFLRATYWRWAQTILEICPDLADAPPVLAIGDAHLENFGAWRDVDARLVWGVNDFDEAAPMPYLLDILRLAASALLARDDKSLDAHAICDAILTGYTAGLAKPVPFVLERDFKWLRKAVILPEADRTDFWAKFDALTPAPSPPKPYVDALIAAMPIPGSSPAIFPRTAGAGSLGRPRFVGRIDWRGGPVLREAKAIVQSAWSLQYAPDDHAIRIADIVEGRFRAPDPHYLLMGPIVTRRISPNSRKIEVKVAADELISPDMLGAMAREIANCHAGDMAQLPGLLEDLKRRPVGWLHDAAKAAAQSVAKDQAAFAAG